MSPAGPFGFTSTKPFRAADGTLCVLDGVPLSLRGSIIKNPGPGANLLTMGDLSKVIQNDWRDDDAPERYDSYTFKVAQRAVLEPAWWKIKSVWSRPRAVVLVDFDYEVVTFSAGPELETFPLPRATAASLYSGFPSDYPIVALLNDVAQTVITAGTPGAGEIKVLGSTVSTPGLTSGDILEIRYVPGFKVLIQATEQAYAGSNDLTRTIDFVETGRQ